MRKLVLVALLAVSLNGIAQQKRERINSDKKEQLTPEQRQEKHLKKLSADLNLNAKQQAEVKTLLAEQNAKAIELKAFRNAKKDQQLLASANERKEMAMKLKAEKDANDAKMKSILTPEQYTKWENNKAIQREKMLQRRENEKKHKSHE